MAFVATNRVVVNDQTSNYRGQYGTVMRVDSDFAYVRLDGQAGEDETPFRQGQLKGTSLASPIDYSHSAG